jgi:hypothetical protein
VCILDITLSPETPIINIKHNHSGIKSYKYNNDDNIVTVSACPEGIPIHPCCSSFGKLEHLIKGLLIS